MTSGRPRRIQLSRKKGWRVPDNTLSVARPGKWGNPFVIGQWTFVWHRPGCAPGWPREPVYRDGFQVRDAAHAVRLFAHAMKGEPDWYHDTWKAPDVSALRGKNLACWCPLGEPCHADVLLDLANA